MELHRKFMLSELFIETIMVMSSIYLDGDNVKNKGVARNFFIPRRIIKTARKACVNF